MAYIDDLKALIETHPSWPTVDDDTLVTWVNEEVVPVDRETLTSSEIFATCVGNSTNRAEWLALTADQQTVVRDILYLAVNGGVPTASGAPERDVLIAILGTNTKQALAAAISKNVSRAANAGIAKVVPKGDIEYARTI